MFDGGDGVAPAAELVCERLVGGRGDVPLVGDEVALHGDGEEQVVGDELAVVEGLEGALSLSRFEGSIVWQLRLVKAVQLVKAGEADAGLDLLQGFAEAVVDYLETMCVGKPDVPALLDRSVFVFGDVCPPELVRKGQESSRESLIKMFEHDRDLEPYHDDPRYQQALKTLREWRAK